MGQPGPAHGDHPVARGQTPVGAGPGDDQHGDQQGAHLGEEGPRALVEECLHRYTGANGGGEHPPPACRRGRRHQGEHDARHHVVRHHHCLEQAPGGEAGGRQPDHNGKIMPAPRGSHTAADGDHKGAEATRTGCHDSLGQVGREGHPGRGPVHRGERRLFDQDLTRLVEVREQHEHRHKGRCHSGPKQH